MWTKNADKMSELYSGTGALKTDFTRTGKRTFAGSLEDGKRALLRYVINNFEDTYHQNSLDLLLGKINSSDLKETGIKGKSLAFNFAFVNLESPNVKSLADDCSRNIGLVPQRLPWASDELDHVPAVPDRERPDGMDLPRL